MSRTVTSLVLLSIAAATAGCASIGRSDGQEKALVPQSLAFQKSAADDSVFVAGDWPAANWWAVFDDPKLDALITQALADNPSLRVAEARVRAAADFAQAARSALFPTLDFNAAGTRQRASDNVVAAGDLRGRTVNGGRVALDFNYEFDFWGRNRDELSAALGEMRAADADKEAARLVLAAAVAQTYFQLQADIASADVARQTLSERAGLRELNLRRVSRGLQSNIPSRQSDQQVASSRVDVAAAEAAVQLSRHGLAALLGAGPDATLLRGRETKTERIPADFVGIGLLALGVGSLQILLDRGKDLDWFNSSTIVTLGVVAAIGLSFFIAWELTDKRPAVDLRLFARRNFTIGATTLALATQ